MSRDISKDNIVINQNGYYEINGKTEENNVLISCQATVILNNVDIDLRSKSKAAIYLEQSAEVTLIIKGQNSLKSGDNYAGIQMNGKCRIIIMGDDNNSTLNIESGTSGAGIGGGSGTDLEGNITIESGNINIVATREGAGIGGGNGGNGGGNLLGILIIDGGNINIASGMSGGAGIGGGEFGSLVGSVIINGGNINSVKVNKGLGAGIGGGYDGNLSGSIIINNGTIIAQGGEGSAGIGGGIRINKGGNLSGTVIINGGDTTATGGSYIDFFGGAGIGGGYNGNLSGQVKLNNGNITALGFGSADDIGAGTNGAVIGEVNIKVKSIEVNPVLLELNVGDSSTIESIVTLQPTVNAKVSNYENIEYTSDDINIAIVDENGLVTAIGNGETNINAICTVDKTKSAICRVKVNSKMINIGKIDLLIQVNKIELNETDLSNVICYGNNPIIIDIQLEENIKSTVVKMQMPICLDGVEATVEYKKISVYLTVGYSIALYSTQNCLNGLKIYALQPSVTSSYVDFCIQKNQDIDISKFKVALFPKYEVDKNYSEKYYIFKVTGDIKLFTT